MKLRVASWMGAAVLVAAGCFAAETSATVRLLTAEEFSTELGSRAGAQLLDVRTREEFAKGHLPRAVNLDWNGADFDAGIRYLDPARPVFVYCLSGSRSAAAARRLASGGFREVSDLAGGILKWRAAGLPQVVSAAAPRGMTRREFDDRMRGPKPVLVDFYADWCIPCRQMKPDLDNLAEELKAHLEIVRINADDNQDLLRELKIDTLPALAFYREGSLAWTKTGFTDGRELRQRLRAAGVR